MISKKFVLPMIPVTLALASACGLKNNMDEMHDDTHKMATTTENLAKKTDHVADTSDHLGKTSDHLAETSDELNRKTTRIVDDSDHLVAQTDHLVTQTDHLVQDSDHLVVKTDEVAHTADATYTDLRQGNSTTLRADRIRDLKAVQSFEMKISNAGQYFMAFEFQLVKEFGSDNDARRQALYLDAAEQFFRDIHEFMDGKMSVDPTSTKDDMRNLFALAVSMHRINPNALELVKKNLNLDDFEAERQGPSMLNVIKNTLKNKSDVESGRITWDNVPHFQKELLAKEKEAVYLLKLRANFLPVMTLSKLTKLDHASIFTKLWKILFHYKGHVSTLSFAEIKEYTRWIKEANDTRDFLRNTLHADPEMNSKVLKLYRHMDIPSSEIPALVKSPKTDKDNANNLRVEALKAFTFEIERFRK